MKIGLLSDTHDQEAVSLQAVRRLMERDASAVLHCGDIGRPALLEALYAELHPAGIPLFAVLGNCDRWSRAWDRFPALSGLTLWPDCGVVEWAGLRIGLLHGDGPVPPEFKRCDLVCSGHTHVPHDRIQAGVRLLNPGSIGKSRPPTAALYDTETGQFEVIRLEPEAG